MSIDMERIEGLLNIANLAKQWPNLKKVHDLAMKELEGIDAEGNTDSDRARKAVAQAQAAHQQEIQAHQKTKAIATDLQNQLDAEVGAHEETKAKLIALEAPKEEVPEQAEVKRREVPEEVNHGA